MYIGRVDIAGAQRVPPHIMLVCIFLCVLDAEAVYGQVYVRQYTCCLSTRPTSMHRRSRGVSLAVPTILSAAFYLYFCPGRAAAACYAPQRPEHDFWRKVTVTRLKEQNRMNARYTYQLFFGRMMTLESNASRWMPLHGLMAMPIRMFHI